MAAATVTKLKATPNRLTYLVVGGANGAAVEVIANATLIADMVVGPLKRAWSATYASQALARSGLSQGVTKVQGGYCRILHSTRLAKAMTTTKRAGFMVDVNLSATLPIVEFKTDQVTTLDAYILDLVFRPAVVG